MNNFIPKFGEAQKERKEVLMTAEKSRKSVKRFAKIAGVATGCAVVAVAFVIGMQVDHLRTPIKINFQNPVIWRSAPSPTPVKKASRMPVIVPQVMAEAVPPPKVQVSPTRHPSDEYVANLVKSYAWDYSIAIRLAKSENYYNLTGSFDCARTNTNADGSYDVGLFQINSIHSQRLASLGLTMEDMKDCKKNADYAFHWVYTYSGWGAWSAFNNLSYINHSVI